MDAVRGLCEGCHRTLDEIAVWSLLDDAEKRAVWKQLHERRRVAAKAIATNGAVAAAPFAPFAPFAPAPPPEQA